MDVVSLHQAGVEHAVASSGTSLTDEQIRLMKRFTSNVTVLYDGDAAGVRAAMRGIDMLLEQGLNVRVVQFPDGHDPDSYVRAVGGQAFKEFLKAQSQDFILFKTNMFLAEAAGDPIRKGEAIRDIVQSIARIPDPIKQAVFYQQCASLLGVDEALLAAEGTKWADEEARRQRKQEAYRKGKERPLGEPARKPLPEPPLGIEDVEGMVFSEEGEEGWGWDDGGAPIGQQEEAPMWVDDDGTRMPLPIAKADPLIEAIFAQEQETIRLLLLYGHGEADEGRSVADYMLAEMGSLAFRHPVYAPMLEEFRKACAAGKSLKSDHFLHHSNPDFRKEAADLLLVPYELNKWPIPVRPLDDNLGGLAYKNLLRLKFHTNKHLLAHLEAELQQASLRNDLHQEQEIMSLYLSLKRQQVEISKITGDFIIV
jgi:DNA primase